MIAENDLRIDNWVDVRNSNYTSFDKEPRYTLVDSVGCGGINTTTG